MYTRSRFWPVVAACCLVASWLTSLGADTGAARAYLQAGDLLARQWRYRDALAMYSRAERIAEGEQRIDAVLGVVSAAIRLGNFELAYAKTRPLLALGEGHARARTVCAEASWGMGLFDEAEGGFRDALAANPSDERARLGLARVLLARGRLDDALQNVLAAASAAPEYADGHYLSGLVYERLRQPERAVEAFLRYLRVAPATGSDKREWIAARIELLRSLGARMPARIDGVPEDRTETVPFRIVEDKIVIQARINDGQPIDFQVDTGAETTVVSTEATRRAGIVPIAPTQIAGIGDGQLRNLQNVRIPSLRIGTLVIRDVPALMNPSSDVEGRSAGGNNLSPLQLGLSVVIDRRRGAITFANELPAMRDEVELPLWFYRLATVDGAIRGQRGGRFIVDTGSRAISIARESAQAITADARTRRIPVPVFGTSGRDRDAYLLLGVNMAFGPIPLNNSPVLVVDLRTPGERLGHRLEGIMGQHLLGKYRVRIDLRRGVLGLTAHY